QGAARHDHGRLTRCRLRKAMGGSTLSGCGYSVPAGLAAQWIDMARAKGCDDRGRCRNDPDGFDDPAHRRNRRRRATSLPPRESPPVAKRREFDLAGRLWTVGTGADMPPVRPKGQVPESGGRDGTRTRMFQTRISGWRPGAFTRPPSIWDVAGQCPGTK